MVIDFNFLEAVNPFPYPGPFLAIPEPGPTTESVKSPN